MTLTHVLALQAHLAIGEGDFLAFDQCGNEFLQCEAVAEAGVETGVGSEFRGGGAGEFGFGELAVIGAYEFEKLVRVNLCGGCFGHINVG